MKKVRVNKKYGIWYYEKQTSYDLEFPIYEFWNKEKTEYYVVSLYSQVLECIREGTKEAREKYIEIYG